MKKVTILVLIMFGLVGCSAENVQKQADMTSPVPVSTNLVKEQVEATQEPTAQTKALNQQSISETTQIPIDNSWFAGSIGNSKIHAKLDVIGDTVSGFYYYDQYKTNITLHGHLGEYNQLKDFQSISLTEDTAKQGVIKGVLRTNDYIEGYWKSGNDIYPMYLIRESSDIAPPKEPSLNTSKFDGDWTGEDSNYFCGSKAEIKVLFDDLIYYSLSAHNGTHFGTLDSFGIIDNGVSKTVFTDTTDFQSGENVVFEFMIDNNLLKLKSNDYNYYCGMGVAFSSNFVKGNINFDIPTALEVGIVDTKDQDDLFKKLVEDKYNYFIAYTAGVDYSEVILDGEKVKCGTSYLRGANGYCVYIISEKHIYAAIMDNGINYYTNDINYAERIPEPMIEWLRDIKEIKYNYKEVFLK